MEKLSTRLILRNKRFIFNMTDFSVCDLLVTWITRKNYLGKQELINLIENQLKERRNNM